jgi:hypothetical protein
MKIICDCGNEMKLVEDVGNEEVKGDERGEYVTRDYSKFNFWSEHDECGIVCKKCNRAIWMFT